MINHPDSDHIKAYFSVILPSINIVFLSNYK